MVFYLFVANYRLFFATNNIFCTFVANYNCYIVMKQKIIGREREKALLDRIYHSGKAEFVAVCGRRRVGKTFLIKEFFEDQLVFQTAGLANDGLSRQLKVFYEDLVECGLPRQAGPPKGWIDAFLLLRQLIKQSHLDRKVILLDELPWMDTPRSGFVQALEHFWNSWASSRHDVVLIVCGSATSWMMNKLINNHGGLHNRLTSQMFLEPFTLRESELFLRSRGFHLSRYEVAVGYMILGGVPYYLDMLDSRFSLANNINDLLFRPKGLLSNEFSNLYAALFKNSADYIKVVEVLSKKRIGMSRTEIIAATSIPSGNGLSTLLNNLEWCGFIRKYRNYKALRKETWLYQLVDFFTIFHFSFLTDKKINQWSAMQGTPVFNTWAGLTFELLALNHIDQIKMKLGINGINTAEYAWRAPGAGQGAQIDLVIDRADNTVNLCEMKFSIGNYSIDKHYEMNLRNKISRFMESAGRHQSIQLTFVTTFGIEPNTHSGIVNNEVILDDLFA